MSQYRRLTKGLVDVGTLIPAGSDPYKYITDTKKDWYLSIYKYNEDQKNLAEEIVDATKKIKNKETGKTEEITYKRPRGVEGIEDVTTNMLVWNETPRLVGGEFHLNAWDYNEDDIIL